MLPVAFTLGIALTSYIIHSLQQRANTGPVLDPQAVINCLRYTNNTDTRKQVLLNQAQAYFDPILNRPNIAAYIGTRGADCELFIDTVKQAYQTGPWAESIFRITLGLNHDLKLIISPDIRKILPSVGGFLHHANAIILESLENTGSKYKNPLWDSAHVLRHEMVHAFIDLYNKNADKPISKPEFIKAAVEAFSESAIKIREIRVDFSNYEAIEILKSQVNLIINQFNFYPNVENPAIELITHLIQCIDENLIKEHFPFFATLIENMIKHFEHSALTPHPEGLDDNQWYSPHYAFEQEYYLALKDYNLEEPYGLIQQAREAIQKNDRVPLLYNEAFFKHPETKVKLDKLKTKNEHAYVACHLLAAQSYDFLGDHKRAYKHFQAAWEIDQSKTIETHQFNGEQLQRMFELRNKLAPIKNEFTKRLQI